MCFSLFYLCYMFYSFLIISKFYILYIKIFYQILFCSSLFLFDKYLLMCCFAAILRNIYVYFSFHPYENYPEWTQSHLILTLIFWEQIIYAYLCLFFWPWVVVAFFPTLAIYSASSCFSVIMMSFSLEISFFLPLFIYYLSINNLRFSRCIIHQFLLPIWSLHCILPHMLTWSTRHV